MKRLFLLCLVLISVISLSACDGQSQEGSNSIVGTWETTAQIMSNDDESPMDSESTYYTVIEFRPDGNSMVNTGNKEMLGYYVLEDDGTVTVFYGPHEMKGTFVDGVLTMESFIDNWFERYEKITS